MKARDYFFWITLTFSSLLIGHWLHLLRESPAGIAPDAPRATLVSKATYWLAVWRIGHHFAPRKVPEFRELPDEVVNAPAVRTIGPDGEPLLAHGEGW